MKYPVLFLYEQKYVKSNTCLLNDLAPCFKNGCRCHEGSKGNTFT